MNGKIMRFKSQIHHICKLFSVCLQTDCQNLFAACFFGSFQRSACDWPLRGVYPPHTFVDDRWRRCMTNKTTGHRPRERYLQDILLPYLLQWGSPEDAILSFSFEGTAAVLTTNVSIRGFVSFSTTIARCSLQKWVLFPVFISPILTTWIY